MHCNTAIPLAHVTPRWVQSLHECCCTPCRYLCITWPDLTRDYCHVRPMMYLADLQEQSALLSLKSTGTNMPDVQYLIPKNFLADVDTPLDSFPIRTEADHKQAAQQYHSSNAEHQAVGQELLTNLSMKPVRNVALWDFFDNVYAAFPPDVLHQCYIGMTNHILDVVNMWLKRCQGSLGYKQQINERLAAMRPLHEAYYPQTGLNAPKMQGTETKSLLQFLAPALYGLAPDNMTSVIAGVQSVGRRVGLLLRSHGSCIQPRW